MLEIRLAWQTPDIDNKILLNMNISKFRRIQDHVFHEYYSGTFWFFVIWLLIYFSKDAMSNSVIVRDLHVVGMHHHGGRSLEIGGIFQAVHEPNNPYDNNAVAIQTKEGRVVAYLARNHARVVVDVFKYGVALGSVMVRVSSGAEVKKRRYGPQQLVVIGFKVLEGHKEAVVKRFRQNGLIVKDWISCFTIHTFLSISFIFIHQWHFWQKKIV